MEIIGGGADRPSLLLARAADPARAGAGLAAAQDSGAWRAWRRALQLMSPQEVTRIVADSGLRGRGGAGFPTGQKWRSCAAAPDPTRYAVANGFEADPGAQLDRTLMERDPHAILEGLSLASYAIGAHQAHVCLKASSSDAVRSLRQALSEAEDDGLIGPDSMGSGYSLSIEIRELSGSFVLGEETVLLRALESKRAQPDQRPPYPAERGLFNKPTVVNNVETLAAIPGIVLDDGEAFSRIGLPSAPGTTLVQVVGAVGRPGIAEVPMGTRLSEIVALAEGPEEPKAVLFGGPSGGFLPPDELEAPLEPGALEDRGAIWGSGTVLVADDRTCLVDLAATMTRYLNDEACGKTIPCRIGLRRLAEIGDRFTTGHTRPTDTQLLEDLGDDVRDGALCALESTAVNPLRTGMRYFLPEFEAHFERGECPAGVCRPLRMTVPA